MTIQSRPYRDANDLARMRNLLMFGKQANIPASYMHPGCLDFDTHYPPSEQDMRRNLRLWEDTSQEPPALEAWAMYWRHEGTFDLFVSPALHGTPAHEDVDVVFVQLDGRTGMAKLVTTKIEDLAQALLDHGGARASQYAMDVLTFPRLADVPMPKDVSYEVLVVSAAMLELFAQRRGEPPPSWTKDVGGVAQPGLFLMGGYEKKYPWRGNRWREESPAPLKRRNLFASSEFMEFC